MITYQQFGGLYPNLVSFNSGTYTRTRNGKKEIVRKNDRDRAWKYAGIGAGLNAGAAISNDILDEKLLASRIRDAGGYSYKAKVAFPNGRHQFLLDMGIRGNMPQRLALAVPALASGALAGYIVHKVTDKKKRR